MNYYDIKFFHFASFILYIYALLGLSRRPQTKLSKGIYLVISTMLFTSGFMSLSRLGINGIEHFPLWVWGKFIITCILFSAPYILYTRFLKGEHILRAANFIFIVMVLAVAYLGVFKP